MGTRRLDDEAGSAAVAVELSDLPIRAAESGDGGHARCPTSYEIMVAIQPHGARAGALRVGPDRGAGRAPVRSHLLCGPGGSRRCRPV
jgi:hypothetical protein